MNIKQTIADLSKKYDSFYLYDEKSILEHTERLKANFPQVDFLYSVKCNPNRHVLDCVFAKGFGVDAASLGEVLMAARAGLPKEKIYYSAPGKTERDIVEAMDKAILIADSIGEIRRIQDIASQQGITTKIGIRINPDFTFLGDSGQASKFGIDEEQAAAFIQSGQCPNVKITGIHVHVKSQELDAEALLSYYGKMLGLAERFQDLCDGLDYVNMGSGIGIDYEAPCAGLDAETAGKSTENAGLTAGLDLECLGAAADREIRLFREKYPHTKVIIEVGRYAVCKSGYYVTKVIDRKVSYGKTYLILKNTLNGFIRPSIARLIMRYAGAESPAGCEPLFTSENAFAFLTLKEEEASEKVTLVGNLCTAADVAAEDILMPHLECGDCVIMTNAGSYAAVLSPMQFSSQEKPVELFLTAEGKVIGIEE